MRQMFFCLKISAKILFLFCVCGVFYNGNKSDMLDFFSAYEVVNISFKKITYFKMYGFIIFLFNFTS